MATKRLTDSNDTSNTFELREWDPDLELSSTRVRRATEDDYSDAVLIRLGKKPILKVRCPGLLLISATSLVITHECSVNLGSYQFLALAPPYWFAGSQHSCEVSQVMEQGRLTERGSLLDVGLHNGGPAGAIYGFILVWIGSLSVFSTLSELVSMAPVSGGQYHWVAMLAPQSKQVFWSYVEGWLTVLGWQAVSASATFLTTTLILGLAQLTHPNFSMQPYQVTLLFWAIIFIVALINAIGGTVLPKFEGFTLILHSLGFFAIIFPVVFIGKHQNSSEVFDVFYNGGQWPTQGLSFMIGITGTIFVFVGADGAIHMCEEITNATIVVPRAIVFTYVTQGALGLGLLLAVLFYINDLTTVLKPPSGYAFIEIFLQATGSAAGTATMVSIVTTMQFVATVSNVAAASRMLWAFSRDKGIPGWKLISRVERRTTIPLWSVLLTITISCLLSLINLGSTTAFNDIVSLGVSGLYSSYLVVLSLLLWRRCTGKIQRFTSSDTYLTNTRGAQLTWGPWHISGWFGIFVNALACLYLVVALFFIFWPQDSSVTAENMNYSSLLLGAALIFAIGHFFIWGHKEYIGPLMEQDALVAR
ncbi:hypothetical protein MMC14_009872 [Varicellaria rhodocarpa]|nr:hypothetical protein [Varicellaria rhodocarpa]